MTEPKSSYENLLLENRFRVLSPLGEGGMASVYKGVDEHRRLNVAIKFLQYDESDPSMLARFKQEALVLNELDHDNVVHVLGFGNLPDVGPYLILEYVSGESFEEILGTRGPFQIEEGLGLFLQVCDGLNHAHESGVLHRDLKPSNLMLVDEAQRPTVKIVDFGIAKRLARDPKTQALTRKGEFFGSPLYVSPEQCQDQPIDARSDIYALGCVIYEMLTGRPPLMSDSWLGTIMMHVTKMPEAPSTVREEIPPRLDEIVLKCMRKSPQDRYENVMSLRTELMSLCGQLN